MSTSRIVLYMTVFAAATICSDANAGSIMVNLEASMHEVEPGDSFIVSIIGEASGANLTSLNPAISLNPAVLESGIAEITPLSATAGDFWGGQDTTVSETLAGNLAAGKFNVSLDTPGEVSTGGPATVVNFEVQVPADAEEGHKWNIVFLTGATGSTYSLEGGASAQTSFTTLTPGMITVVPEPSSACMLLVGVCGFLRRRRILRSTSG